MGEEVFKKSAVNELEANKIKTKYMSKNPNTQLDIEAANIEKIEEYSYLRSIVSFTRGME